MILRCILFIFFSSALIFSSSCVDDLDFDKLSDARPAPNVIVPVVDLSMRLNDLVERDTILTQDPDGFLRFVYAEDSLFSMTTSEFVSIPAQEALNLENIPILQDSTLGITVEAGLTSLGSMELQQLTFDQLGLAWAISTPAQAPVTVRYTFNNGLIGGTPLQLSVQSAVAGDTAGLVNFQNVVFDLTQSSNPQAPPYNNLSLSLEIIPDPSIPAGTPISVRLDFDSTEVNNVTGFFGQRPVNVPAGDVALELGNISEFTSGFTMTDPSLTFLVRNGMGVSMGIELDLDGVNSDGDVTQLDPSPFEIAQSTTPGTMVATNVRLDKTNSSIVDFLDALPTNLIYSGQMNLNPSNTGGVTNFLSRQDVLQLGLEIDLPMELKTSNLRFEDEVEINLTEDDSLIDFISLGFRCENDFPLDLDIKIFFLDSSRVVLDSVYIPLLDAAAVDANGRGIQASTNDFQVVLEQSQIQTMVRSPYWLIRGQAQSPNNGATAIKIYSDYELKVSLSLKGRVNLSSL